MAIVKSKLLKQLSQNYPNFLKKDLEKFTDIILKEIKKTLRRGERVELRGFGVFSTNIQKARISRNPKTGEKVHTPTKKTIHKKIKRRIASRILSTNKEKWWTVSAFYSECDEIRENDDKMFSFKNVDEKLKFLDGINEYVMNLEQKYSGA